ncbi:glycosyltransferase BC10-like [Rhodamnia argentea]|uniref:Glycosyltransferase BC10-like n=1 Tax=Rhodamnia argentea TaxID=178133 RepID=A0A8B8QV24_9MYRT|nr:glycosyltransferase BC10-like [Rhodamnia argentea]XP_030551081.2 glycosyltransferase BC10-like [Rhodamnia argentea]XP_048140349.1 glycosyltransferase BC10-like [Rhodamnia argentea]
MFTSRFALTLSLLLTLPLLLFFFFPAIYPHKNLPGRDELDDLALFRRASAARSPSRAFPLSRGAASSSARSFPAKFARLGSRTSRPKIAFLFLTNSDLYFSPLWEEFFSGHSRFYNIYIHADPSSKFAPPDGVFRNRLIPSKKTERASPTLIAAARRLLADAILDDPANFYFALVSQHCVPLHSFRYMYNALFGNSISAFNAYIDPGKYKSYIEILSDEPNLYERYTARGEDVMLPEVAFEQFRVGSQFFMLAKRHASLVLEDRKLWRKFRLPCLNKECCYPEEHYFPTLLSMSDPKGCSHYTLTRVNWTGSFDGHPHLYQPEEISPELVHELRQSESNYSYFFARKFSPECLEPLMKIADNVLFKD